MKVGQEYEATSMHSMLNRGKVITSTKNKFSKEYKSPQESKYKMASFTEIVKTKSKITKKAKPVKSNMATKSNF